MSFISITTPWTTDTPTSRGSFVGRIFRSVVREIRLRRALRAVNSLDDRMLMDIGLSPGSTEHAVRRGRFR